MTLNVTPTQDDVFASFQTLFATLVPVGTKVLRGPIDRAAQPTNDHVVITPIHRKRLRTNIVTDNPPPDGPDPNGTVAMEQGVKLEVQVDFYGEVAATNWLDAFTTVFRSEYAVDALKPVCSPLYADEGRMVPLVTGEEQYLERWMVRTFVQYNPVVTAPQQYADTLEVTLINVDEKYPP
jgi:hypothetical protein